MKVFLISDNVDTQTGMRLAGVKGIVVHEEDEFKRALDSTIANREIGIVLITEKLVDMMKDYVMNIKLNYKLPLIVEIPDRHGSTKNENSITAYVREAVGIKI